MNVCVLGLWHLGTVTAACLASAGHMVVGLDFDADTIRALQDGAPPLFEPGLAELVRQELDAHRLRFTTEIALALCDAEIVWVAYDTPVDADDRADVAWVTERVTRLFPFLTPGTLVLISSQLPVGTTRHLEQMYTMKYQSTPISFAYSPENLRLGKALEAFMRPDRVVVGTRTAHDRARIAELFQPITARVEWMSVESAEMTKHALNAFLATSVTFINEIATVCEQVGADAKEVERGLKSEARIGPKAYLAPGGAFAGGTLARDVAFLTEVGAANMLPLHLIPAIRTSNDAHKTWVRRRLQTALGDLRGKCIAVWGLTYKPGTNTLRRSSSVELCEWLFAQGARVIAYDPAIKALPAELATQIELGPLAQPVLYDADALVIATEWGEFRAVSADAVVSAMRTPLVIDANRFLANTLGADARVQYVAVGTPCARGVGE